MPEDLCYNDPTLGLKDLYDKLRRGPGVAAIEPVVAQFGKLANSLAASPDALQRALQGSGVEWRGQTADAAAGALGRAAQWARKASEDTRVGTAQVSDYASSFAALKGKVAAPVPVPTLSTFGSIVDQFAPLSDHAKAVKANRENAIQAYQALAEHERRTHVAITAYPHLETAPPVTRPPGPGSPGPGPRAPAPHSIPGISPAPTAHPGQPSGQPGEPSGGTAPAYANPSTPAPAPPISPGPAGPAPSAPGTPVPGPGPTGVVPPSLLPRTGPGNGSGVAAGRDSAGPGVSGRTGAPGVGSLSDERGLVPRGHATPGGASARPGFAAWGGEPVPGARGPAGAGAMPPPLVGNPPILGGGAGRYDRDRSELPSDEWFEIPIDDDVTDGVIGPEYFTR